MPVRYVVGLVRVKYYKSVIAVKSLKRKIGTLSKGMTS